MTGKQIAAARKLKAAIAVLTTEQLLEAVILLEKDKRPEAQKVLSYTLDELADRLPEDEFLVLVESISYGLD
jgi:hypothetical protein